MMLLMVIASMLVLQGSMVQAWWATGHMLVAQIAWNHLNSNGLATPEVLDSLTNAVTSLVTYSEASNTFVTAACWMDDLKKRNLVAFDNWHYINLPICDFPNTPDYACQNVSVTSVLESPEEDALWAVNEALYTIRSNVSQGFERGFALRNLLHIVGDLHQPLHAVARYSPETPSGDEGGNTFKVRTNITYVDNLHSLWDSGIGMLNNNIVRPLSPTDQEYIENTAQSMMTYAQNLTNQINATDRQSYNVTAWALESRVIAMEYVYTLPYNSIPSPEYVNTSWDIVQQRIALGGYRLALLLQEASTCLADNSNCPKSEKTLEKNAKGWFIAGIVLAAALALSLVINCILYVKASRKGYESINDKHHGHH